MRIKKIKAICYLVGFIGACVMGESSALADCNIDTVKGFVINAMQGPGGTGGLLTVASPSTINTADNSNPNNAILDKVVGN